ncbi:MAG: DUF5659 domain-containing protein [Melioribacteraceae bacterium]|nr:DUF5659 domain-containing protein [Melioribacteraceae bacterium]
MENIYEHRDFYLGAYLIVSGCELISHRREYGATVFVFKGERLLQESITDYFANNAKVNPLEYSAAIRNLKSIIHNNKTVEQHLSTPKSEINNYENNRRNIT